MRTPHTSPRLLTVQVSGRELDAFAKAYGDPNFQGRGDAELQFDGWGELQQVKGLGEENPASIAVLAVLAKHGQIGTVACHD